MVHCQTASHSDRVLVVADEPLYGKGLRLLLETHGFHALYLDSLHRAGRLIDDVRRDTLLWSSDYLDPDGLREIRSMRRKHSGMRLCLLAKKADCGSLKELFSDGGTCGVAVVVRGGKPDVSDVENCLRRVAADEGYVEGSVLDALLTEADPLDPLGELSSVEWQVLALVAEGLRNREIARRLWKSEKAVEKSVARIFNKLGLLPDACPHLDRRVVAAALFLRTRNGRGDVDPDYVTQ